MVCLIYIFKFIYSTVNGGMGDRESEWKQEGQEGFMSIKCDVGLHQSEMKWKWKENNGFGILFACRDNNLCLFDKGGRVRGKE